MIDENINPNTQKAIDNSPYIHVNNRYLSCAIGFDVIIPLTKNTIPIINNIIALALNKLKVR